MKKQIMHFASPELRMKYLKGQFEEIKPVEVKKAPKTEAKEEPKEEPKAEKPKAKKKGKKKDEVQAE